MLWKVLIKLFIRKTEYKRLVKIGTEVYVVDVYTYISPQKELRRWKNAFEKSKAQN